MRVSIITTIVFLIFIACENSNSQHEKNMQKNKFTAWKILSDTNFLVIWEKATLKSLDIITSVLIREKLSQEVINSIKESIINSKEENGYRKGLINDFLKFKSILDTMIDVMYIIELTEDGEVMKSTNWLILSIRNNSYVTIVDSNEGIYLQKTSIDIQALENLIKENYPSALMTSICLDKGEEVLMGDLYISKFTKDNIEVFSFPILCSGFYDKFLMIMQK